MRTILMTIAAGAALLPALAFAQTPASMPGNDVAYCKQLAGTYEHYVGRSEKTNDHDVQRGDLGAQVAANQCKDHTADAIRSLEQSLRDNKVALPPRG